MTDSKRESAARAIKVGIEALSGEWKGTLAEAGKEAVDAWAGGTSRKPDALRREVDQWADGNGTSPASVDDAFRIMTGLLADFGATDKRIVQLRRDPEAVAQDVLSGGAARLARLDADTQAACRQIARTFYSNLIADPQIGTRLTDATAEVLLDRDLDDDSATLSRERQDVLRLRDDLGRYLSVLRQDLSLDVWPRLWGEPTLSVTDLERGLRVTSGPADARDLRDADDVADSSRHLVILAGPGAGKTWLARRIARRAAERALSDLNAGVSIDSIEIPLLVTCEEFRTAPGSPRDAAANPALDRVSDLGAGVGERLKSVLLHRDHGVLLVLDSLDEASPGIRDVDKALIGSWRTVLTSRPAAWLKQWPDTTGAGSPTVTAALEELRYPEDVAGFARAWFGTACDDRTREPAVRFMQQLEGHPAARALSTVPLFLTFLCLIDPEGALPHTRGGLLDQVVNRLLEWRTRGTDGDPALPRLLAAAQQWAWDAAENDAVTGLSRWPDVFTSTRSAAEFSRQERERLDTIAPKVRSAVPGALGRTPRRFVHRAVREHLVARYVAALPLEEAVRQLAIHWFADDTWREIIPTAVVQHPERDALLDGLRADPLRIAGALKDILDANAAALLLRICAESDPAAWNTPHGNDLHALRVQRAVGNPILVARSRHWHASNADAVQALTTYLPTADDWTGDVARALVELDPSEATREVAVQALTTYLPKAGDWNRGVVWSLVDLATSEDTRQAAVRALTAYLPTADHWTGNVAQALVNLATSEDTRQVAVRALSTALPTAKARTGEVARALVDLATSEDTRQVAIEALTAHLPTADHRTRELARLLVDLDPSEATRQVAVQALTIALPTARARTGEVAQALVDLATSEATRQVALQALTSHLATARHRTRDVVGALFDLAANEAAGGDARRVAVQALAAHLLIAGGWTIAPALVSLAKSEATRQVAVQTLTTYLPHAGGWTDNVARVLVELDPSEATRRVAAQTLIAYLPTAGYRTGEVARGLVDLDPSEATRQVAVQALTVDLTTAGDRTSDVAQALVDLATSETTRRGAAQALTAYLPTAGSWTHEVARALRELLHVDEWLDLWK